MGKNSIIRQHALTVNSIWGVNSIWMINITSLIVGALVTLETRLKVPILAVLFYKNFMVIRPVVSEISGGDDPPYASELSKRADAIIR